MKRKLLALLTGALMAVSIMPTAASAGTLDVLTLDEEPCELLTVQEETQDLAEDQDLLSDADEVDVTFAEDDFLGAAEYPIWIGKSIMGTDGRSIQITDANKNDVLGDIDGAAATVTYDSTNKILTLNNAVIGDSDNPSVHTLKGIESEQDLTIHLIGDNRIGNVVTDVENSSHADFSTESGIECYNNSSGHHEYCNLSFAGDGNLTIYDSVLGIEAKSVTFGDDFTGKLTVKDLGGGATCAIYGDENVTINSGVFDLLSVQSYGIASMGKIKTTGGDIKIKAEHGFYCAGATDNLISIENTTIDFVNTDYQWAQDRVGFKCDGDISLTNSNITINAGGDDAMGIRAGKNLSIAGDLSILNIHADGHPVFVDGDIKVDDKFSFVCSDEIVDFDKATEPAYVLDNYGNKIIAKSEGDIPSTIVLKTSSANVPVLGDKSAAKVKGKVDGNTITIANITPSTIETIGAGDNIIVDLTEFDKAINAIAIPKTAFNNVAVSGAKGLEVRFANGATATFDKEALPAVVKQAEDNTVQLKVAREADAEKTLNDAQKAAIKSISKPYVAEVTLTSNSKTIAELNSGKIDVKVPYKASKSAKAWYVPTSGEKSLATSTVDDNAISFEVKKLGHYVLEGSGEGYKECKQDENCVYAKFKDANPKAWYHSGVHFCVENGYMVGVSADKFKPNGTMTRSMIVTMLWRMEESPVVDYAISFKDVKEGQWYTDAIRWGQSTGVVKGYSDTKFGPDDKITREQLVTILKRYATLKGSDVSATDDLAKITDTDKISSWALDGVKWSKGAGIMSGRTKTTIDPDANATRAEAACMIQRLFENVLNK